MSVASQKYTHNICSFQGRIQDFKLGGTHLKKLRRAEGGANIFGIFRVKNHDFTFIYYCVQVITCMLPSYKL